MVSDHRFAWCGTGVKIRGGNMKKSRCTLAAVGVAAFMLISRNSVAETPNSLDNLLTYAFLDFHSCSLAFEMAKKTFNEYGSNSPKTKDAYKQFYERTDKGARNGEARFAALKQELTTKEGAKAALKELYIYWRAEIAPCNTHKNADDVRSSFLLLLERVRVEESW